MKEVSSQSPLPLAFWNITVDELLSSLGTSLKGLPRKDAEERLLKSGSQITDAHVKTNEIKLFLSQFKSPVILLLLFAAALSFVLSDAADTIIILIIVFVSGVLGFWQERGAADAVQKLLATVQIKVKVKRDDARAGRPCVLTIRAARNR